MGTPLNTGVPAAAPERRPGDFQRHPNTGAPYVSHPSRLTKKGQPARVMYGRPSSLGKQIENTTNLQKWSERAVALGSFLDVVARGEAPGLFAELNQLADTQLSLDDPEARPLLDTIAVRAKNLAQAGIAAERGTHTHALTEDVDNERDWIERARSGEDLGIPEAAQTALVAAWSAMLDAEGIEILAVETAVVDDVWRQAGTLDRIARLTRPREFRMPWGTVTLPSGWTGVLDVKTGRLRSGNDGHPDYWHGYAVQIASYAQAVPYDTETDTRGAWEWSIDQRWGIIAHLDVASAIEGAARCRLVLVDLEAGRRAGALCVAARDWEKSRAVFSLVDDEVEHVAEIAAADPAPAAVEVVAEPEDPAPPAGGQPHQFICIRGRCSKCGRTDNLANHVCGPAPEPHVPDVVAQQAAKRAAERPSASPAAQMVAAAADDRRAELRTRKARMRANAADLGWAAEFDAQWRAFGITKDSTDDEIAAALDAIEPPFDTVVDPAPPRGIERPAVVDIRPDNGGPLDQATLDALLATIKASPARLIVNGWLKQAADAGESWSPRVASTVRNFEISRAALALAEAADGDEDCTRMLLGHVVPGAEQPGFAIGVTLGALTIADARRVVALAEAFGNRLHLLYREDGMPHLSGDVAAVLEAAA